MSAPIPEHHWLRLLRFLATRPDGQVILHIRQGEVRCLDCIVVVDGSGATNAAGTVHQRVRV